MIINTDDIRKCRAIALNIDEIQRLDPYIKEAELLWVMPALTAELYYKIEQIVSFDEETGERELDTPGDYETLIAGGYYDDNKKYCAGLVLAVAYLAYARLIIQNPINITAFGVVRKISESSEPVEDGTIVRISKDAEKIGREYLQQCVNYIEFMDLDDGVEEVIPRRRRKFKAIG